MSVLVINRRAGELKLWKHHGQHHDTHVLRILLVMKIYRCWSLSGLAQLVLAE